MGHSLGLRIVHHPPEAAILSPGRSHVVSYCVLDDRAHAWSQQVYIGPKAS